MVRVIAIGIIVTATPSEHEPSEFSTRLLTIRHSSHLHHVEVADSLDADRSKLDHGRRGNTNRSLAEGDHSRPRKEVLEDVPTCLRS